MTKVFALYKHGFGMELQQISIQKDNITITLSSDDWNELQAVLHGKRKSAQTEIKDGEYYPPELLLYN